MSRRKERVSSLVRRTLGQLLLSKLSDPRVDPARTSVTEVEVADDLLSAKVHVSIIGTEQQQRTAIRALQHASGHIQELLMDQIRLRHTPVLRFILDTKYKKTMETLRIIDEAMAELKDEQECNCTQQALADGDD